MLKYEKTIWPIKFVILFLLLITVFSSVALAQVFGAPAFGGSNEHWQYTFLGILFLLAHYFGIFQLIVLFLFFYAFNELQKSKKTKLWKSAALALLIFAVSQGAILLSMPFIVKPSEISFIAMAAAALILFAILGHSDFFIGKTVSKKS